jgi:hypothetical protein
LVTRDGHCWFAFEDIQQCEFLVLDCGWACRDWTQLKDESVSMGFLLWAALGGHYYGNNQSTTFVYVRSNRHKEE